MPKILIVDDEEDITMILKDYLEFNSYDCEIAYSVDKAREIIKNNNFDLIISDVRMPEEDGSELLKWLNNEKIKTKFHFMTGYSDIPREELISLGALGVISKPFKLDDILNIVETSLK